MFPRAPQFVGAGDAHRHCLYRADSRQALDCGRAAVRRPDCTWLGRILASARGSRIFQRVVALSQTSMEEREQTRLKGVCDSAWHLLTGRPGPPRTLCLIAERVRRTA